MADLSFIIRADTKELDVAYKKWNSWISGQMS